MKNRGKKYFGIIVVIFLFIYFIISIFIPFQTSYFGWVEVNNKYSNNNVFFIEATLEEEHIEIKIEESQSFIFEELENEEVIVTIQEVWDLIHVGEKYFVSIETNILKPSYQLKKLYEE